MLEREGPRQAENIAESILIYASGAYLIVMALALGLWLFSRLERPQGPATTERGMRLHAVAGVRLREHRNLFLLALLPPLVFLLMPGLPVIHPLVTVLKPAHSARDRQPCDPQHPALCEPSFVALACSSPR